MINSTLSRALDAVDLALVVQVRINHAGNVLLAVLLPDLAGRLCALLEQLRHSHQVTTPFKPHCCCL